LKKIRKKLTYIKATDLKKFSMENDGLKIVLAVFITGILFAMTGLYAKSYARPISRYLITAQKEMERDNYNVAENYYKKILEIDKDNSEAIRGITVINKINKNYLQVQKNLDILYTMGQANSSEYIEVGKIFLKEKDHKDAIDCFKKAMQIKPEEIDSRNYLVQCYMETEDYESAIKEGKEILKIADSHVESHVNIAVAYHKLYDYKNALTWYEKTLKIDPENATAIYGKKDCLQMADISKKDPEKERSANEWVDKGNVLYNQGDYTGATECYNKALEMDSSNTRALYNLGNCQYAQGNYEMALGYYSKVLFLDPTHELAQRGKDSVLTILGR